MFFFFFFCNYPLTSLSVVFHHFSFERATSGIPAQYRAELKVPKGLPLTAWLDSTPRRAVSSDGKDLVYYFPGAIKPTSVVR